MSDKTHCDLCDQVIPPTVQHLTLLVGWCRGQEGADEEDPRDICPACLAKHPILQRFFEQRFDREPKPQAAKAMTLPEWTATIMAEARAAGMRDSRWCRDRRTRSTASDF